MRSCEGPFQDSFMQLEPHYPSRKRMTTHTFKSAHLITRPLRSLDLTCDQHLLIYRNADPVILGMAPLKRRYAGHHLLVKAYSAGQSCAEAA